jgi:hypothetical protein
VAGIAAFGGADVSIATTGAITETENNYLNSTQVVTLNAELNACLKRKCNKEEQEKIWAKWKKIADFQQNITRQLIESCEFGDTRCLEEAYKGSKVSSEGDELTANSLLTPEIKKYLDKQDAALDYTRNILSGSSSLDIPTPLDGAWANFEYTLNEIEFANKAIERDQKNPKSASIVTRIYYWRLSAGLKHILKFYFYLLIFYEHCFLEVANTVQFYLNAVNKEVNK